MLRLPLRFNKGAKQWCQFIPLSLCLNNPPESQAILRQRAGL